MASDGLLRCVFDGAIGSVDGEIDRRPYHKNCGCALHRRSGDRCRSPHSSRKVSYKVQRSWSEGCLVMAAARSVQSSPSSSPGRAVAAAGAEKTDSRCVPRMETVAEFEI